MAEHPLSALVGHRLPGGRYSLAPHENFLLHDALYSTPTPRPHPLAAFVAAQRGMGVSVAELFRLFESDIDDGPLLVECGLEFHRELTEATEYEVGGVIDAVERRTSRRIGDFDRITCRFTLTDPASGQVAATVTNVFAIPRREAPA